MMQKKLLLIPPQVIVMFTVDHDSYDLAVVNTDEFKFYTNIIVQR